MSKDLHPIDQSFRDAFEHFEATPPELVWDNIASEIKPQKKRRFLLFWLLPIGSLLVGLSYYNWNLAVENKNLQAKNQNLEQVLAEKSSVSPVSTAETIITTNNGIDNTAGLKIGNVKFSNQSSAYQLLKSPTKNTIGADEFSKPNLNTGQIAADFNTRIDIQNVDNLRLKSPLQQEKIENLAAIEKIPLTALKREKTIKFGKKIDCFSFSGKNSNWIKTIELFGGPEFAPRTLSYKDGERNNYINVRDSSEKYVIAYSGGVRGTLTHPSGLGLRFGVSSSHLVERFEYVNKYWKTEVTDPKTGQVTTSQGKLTKQIYNRLTTIDFPIQLGFETLNDKKNWNVGVYAGALLNLQFYKSGEIFNPEGNTKRFNDEYVVFNKKVGLSLIGNVRFQRNFGEHFLLGIEPNVTYQLKNMTDDTYLLNQKYLKAGVQIGLAYRF